MMPYTQVQARAIVALVIAAAITVAIIELTPEHWNQFILLSGMVFSLVVCHWKGVLDAWGVLAIVFLGPVTGLMVLILPLIIKVWPLTKDKTPV